MIREYETAHGRPMDSVGLQTKERLAGDGDARRTAGQRPIGALLKELRDEMSTLVRQEVALARTEMNEKAAKFGRNAGHLGVGGILAHAGVLVLLLGISALLYAGLVAAGLSHMTAGWLAPLIVGAVVTIIGCVLSMKAISALKRESLVPEKTVDSLKEDQQWLRRKATA